jgi:two-component system nitrogen regulation response regulator GlnG
MLTRHFLQQSAKQLGVEPKRISDAALGWLEAFGFPGNVRQLENICHWLTVMAPAQVIEPKDLPPEVSVGNLLADGTSVAPAHSEVVPVVAAEVHVAPTIAAAANLAIPVVLNGHHGWEIELEGEAVEMLASGQTDVWDALAKRFESRLIQAALANTKGRRIEAAQKLGIGRNTITRKIQELGLE